MDWLKNNRAIWIPIAVAVVGVLASEAVMDQGIASIILEVLGVIDSLPVEVPATPEEVIEEGARLCRSLFSA